MRALPLVLVLLIAFPMAIASASASRAKTPEEIVALYFERVKADGIHTVADLMHPEELAKFREMAGPVVEASLAASSKTFRIFADPDNPEKMRAVDDKEFMDTFMDWATKAVPNLSAALKNATIQAIGHVTEGDVKHVVVRMKTKAEDVEIEKMSVWSVRDFEGEPRLMLTGDLKGLAAQLKRMR